MMQLFIEKRIPSQLKRVMIGDFVGVADKR